MDCEVSRGPTFRFGMFELDLRARQLRKNGHKIRLQDHPLKILTYLLERAGEIVTRQELQARLWPDGTVVDFENGLNAAMGKLRRALCESADRPRYIETIPRQGYRFLLDVEVVEPQGSAAAADSESLRPSRFRLRPWIIAAGITAALLLLTMGFEGWRAIRFRPAPPASTCTLAVLPFLYLDPDPEGQYLADGMTEELTTQLARLEPRSLAVIARTSAVAYKSGTKSIAQIGRELGADHLLEGSVRRSGDRLRITAQLIRASDQTHVWAANYERSFGDVLVVEAEIARAVADGVHVVLSPVADDRLRHARTVAPDALEACLRGRYLLWSQERTPDTLAKAQTHFQEAIAADPAYAAPYAGLAEYYALLPDTARTGLKAAILQSKAYASRALTLDGSLAEAHMCLGFAAAAFDRNWRAAGTEFERTFELDPNLVRGRAFHAVYLLAIGRPEEAVAEIRRAQQVDPLGLVLRHQTTRTLLLARHYEETIAEARKILELNPSSISQWAATSQASAHLGRIQDALDALQKAAASLSTRAYVYAAAGQEEKSREARQELEQSFREGGLAAYWLAGAYAAAGDKAAALDWLEKAYQTNDPYLNLRLQQDAVLDPIRGEPRFQKIVRRMDYPR